MTPIILWALFMAPAFAVTAVFLHRNGEFYNFKSRGK